MTTHSLKCVLSAFMFVSAISLAACDDKKPANSTSTGAAHDHDHDHDHEHDHDHAGEGGHHGDGHAVALGTSTIGAFSAAATRDEGTLVAGKDAAIDVTVTAPAGATAKVTGVRFWIGTEDGKGSVKAKAEIEDPKNPNRWHAHAEIPSPIPSGSMLWVEIETDKGETAKGSFGLKM